MRDALNRSSLSDLQKKDGLSSAKQPEASESVNPTITAIDDFVNRSIHTLNYLADTLEKGNELNHSLDKIASLVVEVVTGNPVVKVTVAVTKKITEMVIAEIRRPRELARGAEAGSNPLDSLDDNFIKSTVSAVMESPQVQGIMRDILLTMSDGINSSAGEENRETSGTRRRRMS
jgi:hypothetical protein